MKISYLSLMYALTTSTLVFSDQNIQAVIKEEVSVNEDLMREHGLLNRFLLIYQEIARRIERKKDFPIDTLSRSSRLIKDFLENHHEKIEEQYIFPHFETVDELSDLVHTLKEQHDAGRIMTDYIIAHANEEALRDEKQSALLSRYLKLYVRMFRAHAAREDTVLLPAFQKLLSAEEYEKLSDLLEDLEHEHFGEDGFDNIVAEVADIEKLLGIHNLSDLTPVFNGE